MLKQKVSRIKKVMTILLIVLFVVSLTAVSSSAHGGGRGWGGYGGWGGPGWGSGPGCMWVGGNNWLCPAYSGMPYTVQASKPAEPAKAPDPSPNLAGATLFPETESKDSGTSPATGAPASSDSSAAPSSPASGDSGTSSAS